MRKDMALIDRRLLKIRRSAFYVTPDIVYMGIYKYTLQNVTQQYTLIDSTNNLFMGLYSSYMLGIIWKLDYLSFHWYFFGITLQERAQED